ncbi:hypothetical protein AAMO2058_000189300 [Amorphochlora amoebiformis]
MGQIFSLLDHSDDIRRESGTSRACVGIFESPTGTGKSLSILCSTLHWLLNVRPLKLERQIKAEIEKCGGDFASKWASENALESLKASRQEKASALAKMLKRVERFKMESGTDARTHFSKKRKCLPVQYDNRKKAKTRVREEDFMINYREEAASAHPEDGELVEEKTSRDGGDRGVERDIEALEKMEETPKIIYCSRTHSQLSQFSKELRRTEFGSRTRCVTLGSRKTLCINKTVRNLGSADRINDRCQELRNSSKSACPHLDRNLQGHFRDNALSKPHDIEDLHVVGEEMGACPYYGARKAVPMCHMVLVPYQALLNKDSRESLGLSLKNTVVIIDEAHNLIETINDVHSVSISLRQFRQAHGQISNYYNRYKEKFRFSNEKMIKRMLLVIASLINYLQKKDERVMSKGSFGSIVTLNHLLVQSNIQDINMFHLCDFIKSSGIVKKLNGFLDYIQTEQKENASNSTEPSKHTEKGQKAQNSPLQLSVLGRIKSFLESLTNFDDDGRVYVERKEGPEGKISEASSMRFVMLNPGVSFQGIVEHAQTVVLIGGTMKPFSHFTHQLFPSLPSEKITYFECGHVVPPSHILARAVPKGPTGKALRFTFRSRSSNEILDELGRTILNLSKIIPEGFVIFFPSFGYKDAVAKRWKSTGVANDIGSRKPVLWESRKKSPGEILDEYSKLIKEGESKKGAILMCVVGGKLSEGINFSDGLARCVAVVGMPYPNSEDPQLKEKIAWINRRFEKQRDNQQKLSRKNTQKEERAGQEYYENLCMRAVNQSVGRSIRHKGDYASVLLIDERYCNERVSSQLPAWIRARFRASKSFGEVFRDTRKFYTSISKTTS